MQHVFSNWTTLKPSRLGGDRLSGNRIAAKKRRSSRIALQDRALAFFSALSKDKDGRRLLTEQDHRIEFNLTDSDPFCVQIKGGRIRTVAGVTKPPRYDVNDLVHFQLSAATLARLFEGRIRFTDALIPTQEDGSDAMLLLECTLFKWSVLSWIGRLFRGAQLRSGAHA
jgi:hypothetical protein